MPVASAASARRAGAQRVALAVMVIATVVSLALRWWVPLNPISLRLAAFDGGLFERLAVSLVHHDWLGPLTDTTLAKGPAYPFFIALTHRLHIPLHVGQQALYLAGASSAAACVWITTKRPLAAAFVYVVLALEPSNFSALATQITREHIYTGTALLFVCGSFAAVYCALNDTKPWRAVAFAVVAGVGGAGFWLCREEGLWVVPSIGAMIVLLAAVRFLGDRFDRGHWMHLSEFTGIAGRTALALVVLGVAFYAPIGVVKWKNDKVYGVSFTNDFSYGAFPRAYAAWARVRGVPLRDFVPIDRAQREAVYKVSSAARVLRGRLEDPTNGWQKWACPAESIAAGRGAEGLNICDDYPGGAAMWAIREAATLAGRYKDEKTFQAFFSKLADQIEHACDTGALQCSRALPSSAQLAQRASVGPVVRSAWKWMRLITHHPTVYRLLNVDYMNRMPKPERDTVNQAVFGAPQTQKGALQRARQFEDRAWLYRWIGNAYRLLFPLLLVASVVGLIAGLATRRARVRSFAPLLLAVGLFAAVAVRLILFGVIETTQYFNDMRYQLVARSFLLTAAAIGAVVAYDTAVARRARRWIAARAPTTRSGRG